MNKNIFSGLEDFGFDNIGEVDIFNKKDELKEELKEKKEDDPKNLLYDKEVKCPVCGNVFKAKSVKTSAYRVLKKDSDFFIRYSLINPYFYDVWLCNSCGYASMKADFEKIREFQADAVKSKITRKWTGKDYPEVYDINIAIERYKISLLNYVVTEAKSSKKAMCCLKIAWMYRLLDDTTNENLFLKQALDGFNYAYSNEDFPIYGMDKYTTEFLIGELARRTGDFDEANRWFGRVITSPGANQKMKDLCRDQRDLIKEETEDKLEPKDIENKSNDNKKGGLFSRLFK